VSDDYVRIEGLTRRFGDFTAVDAVSLQVRRGEIFCLLGSSGCGKTTLLRMLAGFEAPTAGRMLLDGQDLSDVPPYERPINMMFQSYALFPHLTVERNVAFGLEQERLPRSEILRRVGEILDIVRMGQYRGRKPQQLSGGQRQRVALARALVKRPKLLLLDEPLGALDRKLREHTQFELLNIQQQLGVTFMVVTHDQEEAMTLASRIGVMDHGRIVQVGTPREIYEFPATRLVADFIGSANLFEGRLLEWGEAGMRIACPELPVPVWVSQAGAVDSDALESGAALWVALRPEKLALQRDGPDRMTGGNDSNWARGQVREVAYLGGQSLFQVSLESGRHVRVTLTNRSRQPLESFAPGDAVLVRWDAASAVVGSQ
jgi:putrescine transport system ATP-binding protein